jgi:hypothetical protein
MKNKAQTPTAPAAAFAIHLLSDPGGLQVIIGGSRYFLNDEKRVSTPNAKSRHLKDLKICKIVIHRGASASETIAH